jgi:hypothetical protein
VLACCFCALLLPLWFASLFSATRLLTSFHSLPLRQYWRISSVLSCLTCQSLSHCASFSSSHDAASMPPTSKPILNIPEGWDISSLTPIQAMAEIQMQRLPRYVFTFTGLLIATDSKAASATPSSTTRHSQTSKSRSAMKSFLLTSLSWSNSLSGSRRPCLASSR